jgi:hypothetical protein
VSAAAWVVITVLAGAVLGLVGLALVLRSRVAVTQARVDALERVVRGDLEASVAAARTEAATAVVLARRAAGVAEPEPRLVLEPVTGRLIRAVALGAGARRAIGRFAGRERRAS